VKEIEQLANRLGAVSVDARRPGRDPHWHKRWRARTLAPDVIAWGDTLEEAVQALVERVEQIQSARRPS
jgi:hypothetical protein